MHECITACYVSPSLLREMLTIQFYEYIICLYGRTIVCITAQYCMMYSNIMMHGGCTKCPLSLICACIYYISESVGVANTYTYIHPFYADYQDWMLDIVASYAYLQHCHTAYTVSFNRM